jgi:hypothetical protein
MSKKSEKLTTVQPVTVRTSLGGPKFRLGYGTPPCRLEISSEVLAASGLKPFDRIEIIAEAGAIRVVKVGEPLPGLPNISSKNEILDNLMRLTSEHEDRLRAARSGIKQDEEQDDEKAQDPFLTDGGE